MPSATARSTRPSVAPATPEPQGRPIAAMIRAALNASKIDSGDVDHINAHGTATPQNDPAEARGFKQVFGERTSRIPVTSVKSMVGHCLGAAGAIEAFTVAIGLTADAAVRAYLQGQLARVNQNRQRHKHG